MAWPAILAGVGALGGYLRNKDEMANAQAQREMNAALMRESPWTGIRPNQMFTPDPSLAGNVLGGALTGVGLGQAIQKAYGGSKTSDVDTVSPLYQYESSIVTNKPIAVGPQSTDPFEFEKMQEWLDKNQSSTDVGKSPLSLYKNYNSPWSQMRRV